MGFLALVIYAFVLFVRPHEWPILGIEETTILRNSLIVAILMFFIHKQKNLHAPHVIAMGLMLFAVVGSLVFTGYFGGAVFFADQFISTALVPMLMINAFANTRTKTYVLFSLVILAGIVIVTDGHVQMTSENGLGWTGNPVLTDSDAAATRRIRYLGPLSDPNDLGMLLVMAIPLIVLFSTRVNTFFKLILWGVVGLFLYGIKLTNSRGTLLAAMSIFGLWFLRTYGLKRCIQLSVIGIPALLVVMSKFRTISADDESAEGRLDAWYEGYQMLMGSPLFGVGVNGFLDHHYLTAHNSFVLAFAEMGLVGVLIWTGLLVTTAVLLIQVSMKKFVPAGIQLTPYQQKEVEGEARIALALLYSATGFAVSAFFLSRTYVPLLYFFVGLAAANYCRATALFPKAPKIYDPRSLMKLSFKVTMAGLVGTYVLVRVAL